MRTLSDCIGDMLRTRTEDQEIEAFLTGDARNPPGDLAVLFETFHLDRLEISVEDRAEDFAAIASRLVHSSAPSLPTRTVRTRIVPRLATAALAAILAVSFAGTAVAADSARPGDLLYGLDRALEQIGINDGGLQERLDEAQSLANDGLTTEALDLLADELASISGNAADALAAAADRIGSRDNPSVAREGVAAMLSWMAETEASGRDFGQGVAEKAGAIGAGQGGGNPSPGPPEDVPGNATETPDDSTGLPDNAQKPDDSDSDTATDQGTGQGQGSGQGSGQGQGSGNPDRGSGGSGGNGSPGGKPDK